MLRFLRHIPPFLPTLIVLVAICYLSLDADPFPDKDSWFTFPGSDKVVHFIMYGGLTGTFCFDYYRRVAAPCKLWLLIVALVVAIIVGIVMELLQAHMGIGRSGDFVDVIANSLGALIGIVVGNRLFTRLFINVEP